MTLATRTLNKWDGRYSSVVTLIYLLRHAESIANEKGVLAGRSNVGLSRLGRTQARGIAKALGNLEIDRIAISPIERCNQTILPFLATTIGRDLPVEISDDFQEMDYGKWSGRKLKILSLKRDWRRVQKSPEEFCFPEGESFREAWNRISNGLDALTDRYPKSKVLVVSHGDIIKMALAQVLGAELKYFQRIHVAPASLSAVEVGRSRVVVYTNRSIATNDLIKKDLAKDRHRSSNRRSFVLGGGRNS